MKFKGIISSALALILLLGSAQVTQVSAIEEDRLTVNDVTGTVLYEEDFEGVNLETDTLTSLGFVESDYKADDPKSNYRITDFVLTNITKDESASNKAATPMPKITNVYATEEELLEINQSTYLANGQKAMLKQFGDKYFLITAPAGVGNAKRWFACDSEGVIDTGATNSANIWFYENGTPYTYQEEGKTTGTLIEADGANARIPTFYSPSPLSGVYTLSMNLMNPRTGPWSGDDGAGFMVNFPSQVAQFYMRKNFIRVDNKQVKAWVNAGTSDYLIQGTATKLGKSPSVNGFKEEKSDELIDMPERVGGEWYNVMVVVDYSARTYRLFDRGLPVYFWHKATNLWTSDLAIDEYEKKAYPLPCLGSARFNVFAGNQPYFDDIVIKYDIQNLEKDLWTDASNGQAQANVYKDLNLLDKFNRAGNTYDVLWTSSNEKVVSNTGVVTRDIKEKNVTLTATLKNGVEYTYNVTVPGLINAEYVNTITFDGEEDANAISFGFNNAVTSNGQWIVVNDPISGGTNKVLKLDMCAGRHYMKSEDYAKIKAANNILVDAVNNRTYELESTPRTNDTGTYFCGTYDKGGTWAGVYVTGNQEDGYVVDSSKYRPNQNFIYLDGSPILDNDGRLIAGSTSRSTSATIEKEDKYVSGEYSLGFRFALPDENGSGRKLNDSRITLSISGNSFSVRENSVVCDDQSRFSLKLDSTRAVKLKKSAQGLYVGKTPDTIGVFDEDQTYIMKMPYTSIGNWRTLTYRIDYNTGIARIFVDGLPVYFEVTDGLAKKYSSEIVFGLPETAVSEDVIHENKTTLVENPPTFTLSSDRFGNALDCTYVIDDLTETYIPNEGKAQVIVNTAPAPLVKTDVVESDVLVTESEGITYSSTNGFKFEQSNPLIAILNAGIGFGTSEGAITASATVGTKTKTKDFTYAVKNRTPYVINSITLTKDGKQVFIPVEGAKIEKLNITNNIGKDATLFVTVYNNGKYKKVAKSNISASGDVNVNLTLEAGDTYKVFVFDGIFRPCTYTEVSMGKVNSAVTLYVVGDSTASLVAESLRSKFTAEVSVNNRATENTTAKSILTEDALNGIITDAKVGDYAVVMVGKKDTSSKAEYKALLSQTVLALRRAGIIPVICTPVDGKETAYIDYQAAVKEIAAAYGIISIDTNIALEDTDYSDAENLSSSGVEKITSKIIEDIKAMLLSI